MSYMDCSRLQRTCSSSTLERGPSNILKLTTEGPRGAVQALRFRSTKNFKKLSAKNYHPFSGEFHARFSQESDARCRNSKCHVKAGLGQPLESDHESSGGQKSSWESLKHAIDVFCRFIRPYAMIARAISVLSMAFLAMENFSDFSPTYFNGVLRVLVEAFGCSLYTGGVNQLTDIEIDKVNKPYRPLASGEYSIMTGSLIVAFWTITSLIIGWTEGSWPLRWVIFIKLFIGTVYSVDLPLLRWKRSGFLAAVTEVTIWGVTLVPYYLHFQTHLLQKPTIFSMPLIFATAFMSFFAVIIALSKDIPDLEGDKMFGIESYASRFGQMRVFWICVTLLEMAYGAGICVGLMSPNPLCKGVLVLGHTIFAAVVWNRAKQIDVKKQDDTEGFHMFLWKLFYAEYMLIPFVRL